MWTRLSPDRRRARSAGSFQPGTSTPETRYGCSDTERPDRSQESTGSSGERPTSPDAVTPPCPERAASNRHTIAETTHSMPLRCPSPDLRVPPCHFCAHAHSKSVRRNNNRMTPLQSPCWLVAAGHPILPQACPTIAQERPPLDKLGRPSLVTATRRPVWPRLANVEGDLNLHGDL